MALAKCRIPIVILTVGLLVCSPGHAQNSDDLGSALQSIGQQYAANYAQPVTDALGANLNAGLFRTADFEGTGLVPAVDLYVGAVAMGSFTAGSASSFRLSDEQIETDDGRTLTIDYPDAALPTAFGNTGSPGTAALIDEETGMTVEEISLPGSLVDTPLAPLAVPQVGVGTVLGTDAQVRYLPETDVSDYGSVGFVGVAARHSVTQYPPPASRSRRTGLVAGADPFEQWAGRNRERLGMGPKRTCKPGHSRTTDYVLRRGSVRKV